MLIGKQEHWRKGVAEAMGQFMGQAWASSGLGVCAVVSRMYRPSPACYQCSQPDPGCWTVNA